MKGFRSLLVVLAVITLVASFGFGQSQSQGCGGTTCVQPDNTYTALDPNTVQIFRLQNGARILLGVNSEDLTLSTGGLTTDTANAAFLPAGAIILGASATVSTTIGTCVGGWQFGDPTTAGRFTGAADTTLTAGESRTLAANGTGAATGIASLTTGIVQQAAAKGRITCTTSNASAGKVRVTVFYLVTTAPLI